MSDSSSASAEQAGNAINVNYVNCSFLKMSLKQIYCGEKSSEYGGKRAMSMGSPIEPRGLFQYLKLKKKNHTQKNNPTHKYSEAVGVFYWGWGKGRKERYHSGK